jgi:hypothetical protein
MYISNTIKLLTLSLAAIATTSVMSAEVSIDESLPPSQLMQKFGNTQLKASAWSPGFANDMLAPGSRDQDYTYGVSASMSSEMAPGYSFSPDRPLGWIDRHSGFSALNSNAGSHVRTYATEIGLYGFTPEVINAETSDVGDRPYASLMYMSNSREYYSKRDDVVWRSTLTLGVLGLDVVGDLQNKVHAIRDIDKARGWSNQISDGGEPTARYSISRQRLLPTGHSNIELKTSFQGSVGYLTEMSYGVSLRIGQINTRWQAFNPELATYREHSAPSFINKGYGESYFSAGVVARARAYNVFLQGQFRDSELTYGANDLRHGIVEAWAGYTHAFSNGYRVSYTLRGHSSELKHGAGDRNVLWGGLTVSKTF